MTPRPHVLVVAKAPVPGRVKTRLARDLGDEAAADLAGAALLDTLAACSTAFGSRCHLALAGEVGEGARAPEVAAALRGWHVFAQEGDGLGERLAHAHRRVGDVAVAPVVQVGMDTPQLTPAELLAAARRMRSGGGVLGPAVDGGWWLLGLAEPTAAAALAGVAMSSPRTGDDTRRALRARGVRLARTTTLRDVDTVEDAALVAREAPATRFAAAWDLLGAEVAS